MPSLENRLQRIRAETDQNRKNLLVAEVVSELLRAIGANNQEPITSNSRPGLQPLGRVATWEEWEQGRAARRALSRKITGGKPLRRAAGNPRKDRMLRALNNGERGMPFL